MPHIEVLPTSTSTAQPGYAFVPDTRYASQSSTSQPVMSRKRQARASNLGAGDISVRQQNAILKHLSDLDRDNHRDVQIPVPKDTSGRGRNNAHSYLGFFLTTAIHTGARGKTTTNARRILMSQKTFANHLADEEASIAQKGSSLQTGPVVPKILPSSEKAAEPTSAQPAKDALEADPLLRTYAPNAPSVELMNALVSAPPLSYNAARAILSGPQKPQRHFCEICGYWGNIRCIKCGARVCGLECQGTHDEGRCLKFYS